MLKCFLICPFGDPDRGEEEARLYWELDGIKKHILARAEQLCAEAGYPVEIADGRRKLAPGEPLPKSGLDWTILEATQRGIDEADAIIMLMNASKPNAYLELGWAQALWQGPIILARKDYAPPSDINNVLVVQYTAEDAVGADAAAVEQVAKNLAHSLTVRFRAGRTNVPFPHWSKSTLARGSVDLHNRFSFGVTPEEWSDIIQSAKSEIIFASTGMSQIRKQEFYWKPANGGPRKSMSLPDLLLLKASEGVKVTVLMYHQSNVTPAHLKRLEASSLKVVQAEIETAFEGWAQARQTYENARMRHRTKPSGDFVEGGDFRVVQMQQRYLPFRATLTESKVIYTLRFYTEAINSGICMIASNGGEGGDPRNKSVYQQVREELLFLIGENLDASEARYQAWLQANG